MLKVPAGIVWQLAVPQDSSQLKKCASFYLRQDTPSYSRRTQSVGEKTSLFQLQLDLCASKMGSLVDCLWKSGPLPSSCTYAKAWYTRVDYQAV